MCIKLVYIYMEFFQSWPLDFWPDPTLSSPVFGLYWCIQYFSSSL